MPKGFNEDEMRAIKEQLITKGKELISKYGYKRFGIRELTAEVGIANGMFYKFFSSKEKLYLTIIENEKDVFKQKVAGGLLKYKNDPITALKFYYITYMKEIHSNPIMESIIWKEDMTQVALSDLIIHWKAIGLVKSDLNVDVIFTSLRSLVVIVN